MIMHFEENVSKKCIKEIDEMHFKNVLTPGKIVDKVIDPKTGTYKMYRSDYKIRIYFFGSKSNSANERLNHAKIKYAHIYNKSDEISFRYKLRVNKCYIFIKKYKVLNIF